MQVKDIPQTQNDYYTSCYPQITSMLYQGTGLTREAFQARYGFNPVYFSMVPVDGGVDYYAAAGVLLADQAVYIGRY